MKLKDREEIKKMFQFVIDNQELIEDKDSYFGIFARNPKLLSILPGLDPIFKTFISKVESLVPQKSQNITIQKPACKRKCVELDIKKTHVPPKVKPKVEVVTEAMKKWLKKKLMSKNLPEKDDYVNNSFTIKDTPKNNFIFTCKQVKCHEKVTISF